MDSSNKFGLATLLGWITVFSFLLASSRWAVTSTMLGTPENIPIAYIFGFPLMGFGLFIAPFLCLACLVVICILNWHLKTLFSSLIFLGYGALALLASEWSPINGWWQSGSRILLLMVLCTSACVLETYFRGFPKQQWWVAGMAGAASFAYFLHLAAIVACIAA